MREIAYITDRVSVDGENPFMIHLIKHQLVPRLFHMLEPRVERIAAALVICLDQKRLRRAASAGAILSPHKRVRPIRIRAERFIIYERCRWPIQQ